MWLKEEMVRTRPDPSDLTRPDLTCMRAGWCGTCGFGCVSISDSASAPATAPAAG